MSTANTTAIGLTGRSSDQSARLRSRVDAADHQDHAGERHRRAPDLLPRGRA